MELLNPRWPSLELYRFFSRIIAAYLEVQLFITNMSLPVLIWWGLPVSLASPLGNALFSPILTLWLICSSLLFLTEFLCIPNTFLIYLLDYLTKIYTWLLSWAPRWCMLPIYKPPLLILVLFGIVTLYILQSTLFTRPWQRIHAYILSFLVFIVVCSTLRLCMPPRIHTLDCPPGTLTLMATSEKTIVIDPGYLNKNWSDQSWIEYQLTPYIIQYTGNDFIDTLILLKATQKTFENLTRLIIPTITIKCIYCCIDTITKNKFSDQIKKLYKLCYVRNIKLHILTYSQTIEIYHHASTHIVLTHQSKKIGWSAQGIFSNKPFHISCR